VNSAPQSATDPKIKLNDPYDFSGWGDESFALGQSVAYIGIVNGGQPSAAYKAAGLKVVRKRVAWAGYRLAALLNPIWP
jgi:hypothetical protein